MKQLPFSILAITLLTAASPALGSSPDNTLRAIGTGLQMTPSVTTDGRVIAVMHVDTAAGVANYKVAIADLSSAEVSTEIHGPAAPGTSGPSLHTLPSGNVKIGSWAYPPAMESQLLAGEMYIQVNTMNQPTGEVRGQLVHLVAILDPEQVLPQPNPLSASGGYALFTIDTATNTLNYTIEYEPAVPSGELMAHIHTDAVHGTNQVGVPPHTLPAGPMKTGSWNYDESYEQLLLEGRTYVLIHSFMFPGGELRGQIVNSVSILDESQVVPPTGSPGYGWAICSLNSDTGELGYDVEWRDLTGMETIAAVHGPAPAGSGAPQVFSMPLGPRKLGNETLSPDNVQAFLDCELYIDLHTSAFSDGEIRGQLEPVPDVGPVGPVFERGDCNGDDAYNIADPIALLGFLFPGAMPTIIGCDDACDCNDDGMLNIADAICALSGLFGMPAIPPAPPAGTCGVDPTEPDGLGCAMPAVCTP